jgi:hypothetical protein
MTYQDRYPVMYNSLSELGLGELPCEDKWAADDG